MNDILNKEQKGGHHRLHGAKADIIRCLTARVQIQEFNSEDLFRQLDRRTDYCVCGIGSNEPYGNPMVFMTFSNC